MAGGGGGAVAGQLCGTQGSPQLDPQALGVIGATQAQALGYDGAGVTVAVLGDGLDPANPDLLRNPAYGPAGAPVVTHYQDFSGDGTGRPPTGPKLLAMPVPSPPRATGPTTSPVT